MKMYNYEGHLKRTGNAEVVQCYILASAGNNFYVRD